MFKKPVVFVVGAGASHEYGLALGMDLKEAVAADLKFGFDLYKQVSGSQQLIRILKQNFRHEAQQYIDIGRQLSATMSLHHSIDEALHYFSGNEKAVTLGKLAIANQLLSSERRSTLPNDDDPGALNIFVPSAAKEWLFHFLSMVVSGTQIEERPIFENVTIINFNYDRSIEHFLFYALQRNAACSEDATREALLQLNVIRPYGTLGLLPWQEPNAGIGYGGPNSDNTILAASRTIRTFTEQFIDKELGERIVNALSEAKLVVFLGFGFHQQNMELLTTPGRAWNPLVLATSKGIDPASHDEITRSLQNSLKTAEVALHDMTSTQLLVNLRPVITLRA